VVLGVLVSVGIPNFVRVRGLVLKTRIMRLPHTERILTCLAVLTRYWTDVRTDRQTDGNATAVSRFA